MLKLQDNEVVYNDSENLGAVKDMNYTGSGFYISTLMEFIPEEDCSTSEKTVFDAYHEYYKDTSGAKPAPLLDIEQIRAQVIDTMNQECGKHILEGFISNAFNGVDDKTYDCELTDQSRISGLVSIAQLRIMNLSTEPIKWKATGELECYEWTPEQILVLGLDLKKHIEKNTDIFYAFRIYALDPARTIQELEGLSWESILS
jgi:hypothetical protein